MRNTEFREWLSGRTYQGMKLTEKGVNSRVRKAPRIERALKELGFAEGDLDTVHANGRWSDLVKSVALVAKDWRINEAAARKMAPQAQDPTRQLTNLINVARQYGHFADGKDPNYDLDDATDPGAQDVSEIDEAALEALKAKFLAKYPDFEAGGGFPGQSSFHPVEDSYKRALIEEVRALLDDHASNDATIGGKLLDLLFGKNNLIGDYRRKNHLIALRNREGAAFEAPIGALLRSTADPADAAEAFAKQVWPMLMVASEKSKPYGDMRVLASLPQALARPSLAIAINTSRWYNLGEALLGRSPFANVVLSADEYRNVLDVAAEVFAAMEGWGWAPRDLWDVQGFIWDTCQEKLTMSKESAADKVRQYAIENYILPARERGDAQVSIRAGDVHNALGLSEAHANVCQALRGRKLQELAGVEVPSFTGPDNSSTTTFTYSLMQKELIGADLGDGPFWFVGAAFGRKDDQFDRFIQGGIWEIADPSAAQRSQVLSMQVGQRIAIKATYVRRLNLPFDNKGRAVSVMSIKAVGTITHNPINGTSVSVKWEPHFQPREWYHYTYQPTIWEVYPDKEMARRLIAFAFHGVGQDYAWFLANLSNWKDGLVAEEDAQPERRNRKPTNLILYGPPGTGKTWSTMAEAVRLCLGLDEKDGLLREEARREELRVEYERMRELGQIAFITFHQNYAYEDFIEGREPRPIEGSAGFELVSRAGIFVQLAEAAAKSDEEFVLIIDEINRANISKIFGELITLIEPDKRKGMTNALTLRLPYSQALFSVPANLHIIGTMNTADRSIAQLDTALRRRFVFSEIEPDSSRLPVQVEDVPLRAVLETINDRIEYLVDREHRIGHAFFINCKNCLDIDEAMRSKIIPLLQEYFFEDWANIAVVLGDPKGENFLTCRRISDPTGEGREPRSSWSVRKEFKAESYKRLVGLNVPANPLHAEQPLSE